MKLLPPLAQLDRIVRWLWRVPSQLLVGFGLAVLGATLLLTNLIADKNLAVALAIVGTFIGTFALSLFLPKAIATGKRHELRREFANAQISEQLQHAQGRLQAAEWEIARLESMRINLDTLKPMLKLGLLEVQTSITDYQHRIVDRPERRFWSRHHSRQAYAGVVRIPVKAHLGVDLQKVRVWLDGPRLALSGLEMLTVVDTAEGAQWLQDEVRTELLQGEQVVRFRGNAQDQRAKAFSREQEQQLRARLKQGQDFKVFEPGLIRAAQQVLQVLLAPLGREVIFVSEPPADAKDLLSFLGQHNQQLTTKIAELQGAVTRQHP